MYDRHAWPQAVAISCKTKRLCLRSPYIFGRPVLIVCESVWSRWPKLLQENYLDTKLPRGLNSRVGKTSCEKKRRSDYLKVWRGLPWWCFKIRLSLATIVNPRCSQANRERSAIVPGKFRWSCMPDFVKNLKMKALTGLLVSGFWLWREGKDIGAVFLQVNRKSAVKLNPYLKSVGLSVFLNVNTSSILSRIFFFSLIQLTKKEIGQSGISSRSGRR